MALSHAKIMAATKGSVGDFVRRHAHTNAIKNVTVINRLKKLYMTDEQFKKEFNIPEDDEK